MVQGDKQSGFVLAEAIAALLVMSALAIILAGLVSSFARSVQTVMGSEDTTQIRLMRYQAEVRRTERDINKESLSGEIHGHHVFSSDRDPMSARNCNYDVVGRICR